MSGGSSGSYKYDGNLKRVKAVVDGKTIYNIFDAAGTLVYVDEVSDGKKTEYIHAAGQVIARISTNDVTCTNDVTYIHSDHLGTPIAGTNSSGRVLWREEYTPFGEKFKSNAANDDLGGYTGHIHDSATGLTYMQARYYDPAMGRFLSNDPVGFRASNPASFNRYTYASNNPMNRTDPTGMVDSKYHDATIVDEYDLDQADSGGSTAAESSSSSTSASSSSTSSADRQKTFDSALNGLSEEGKIGDHKVNFVNEFAAAEINSNGNITKTNTYDSVNSRDKAISENPSLSPINGETVVGSSTSTVFAGATLPRRGSIEVFSGVRKPISFSGEQNARFVILHEIEHGKGVFSESKANRNALSK